MVRRKVVTSVNLDPDVFEMGREEGYNFSELLEKAILSKNDLKKEIYLLNSEIRHYSSKLRELEEKRDTLQDALEKQEHTILEDALIDHMATYRLHGVLPDGLEKRLCSRLGINQTELYGAFETKLKEES